MRLSSAPWPASYTWGPLTMPAPALPLSPAAPTPPPPLRGREEELQRALGALTGAARGKRLGAVLLRGAEGSGKSHLVDSVLGALGELGTQDRVTRVAFAPGEPPPAHGLDRLLRGVLGLPETLAGEPLLAALRGVPAPRRGGGAGRPAALRALVAAARHRGPGPRRADSARGVGDGSGRGARPRGVAGRAGRPAGADRCAARGTPGAGPVAAVRAAPASAATATGAARPILGSRE